MWSLIVSCFFVEDSKVVHVICVYVSFHVQIILLVK